jgi:ribokinase
LKVAHIVRPGETILASAHERRVGGKGANQAVAIARAGGRAAFYGTVGQDGLWMVKRMESLGVDVSHLLVSEVGVFAMMNEVGVKHA